MFRYPNDQPIEASARLLAGELNRVVHRQPGRGVSVVATSMGGLVARVVVEDPDLDPGNVRRLIMAGTPNRGSRLAEAAFALELWEHVVRDEDRAPVERFYGAIEDGLGGAYEDLEPGSEFLRRLNARTRNPQVSYTIFLGSGGLLSEGDVEAARRTLARSGDQNRWVRLLGPRLDEVLADLDEVVRGKGDGVVSIERGRLAGVGEVRVLPVDHDSLITRERTPAERDLRRQVIECLKNED
jgi:hypothetical protein